MTGFGAQQNNSKPGRKEDDIKRHDAAVRSHLHGNISYAEKAYRNAMASGHANSATYFNLSSICQAKGDYKEAISLLNKSIELREDFPDAYTNLGRIYMRIGHNEVALKFILK